jgi:hypothetical protein
VKEKKITKRSHSRTEAMDAKGIMKQERERREDNRSCMPQVISKMMMEDEKSRAQLA